jgi:hypothetical protein
MMVKKKEKDGYMVVIPDRIKKKIEDAPDEVKEEIEKLMQGFISGELNPMMVGSGKRVNWKPMKKKLRCGKCGSREITWNRDGEEVYYHCECGESAWMYYKEYLRAMKTHPDAVFE